jgi:vitamin K-dependent gamma-carboxylase
VQQALYQRLTRPVDGASIAVVRIALGLLIAVEGANYLLSDWIAVSFLDPDYHFTWRLFDWVQPWGGIGMHVHFAVFTALGILLAAGIAHRIVASLCVLAFTYIFLLDKTEYLNHFYAAILLLILIAAAPADREFSVAAWRRPERPRTVPVWSVWALRFQLGVIYFYAGIAKLNADWFAGEPMGIWLADRADLPLAGPLLEASWAGPAFSWGGLAFDLLIVPLLLWRPTRMLAYSLAVAFHVTNWVIFDIGIFPPMMIAATTIFFDPDWPRTAWVRARRLAARAARLSAHAGRSLPLPAGSAIERPPAGASQAAGRAGPATWAGRLLIPVLAAWIAIQLLVPLRHHLYPGVVHWTEEGHRFAWHMKLRDKQGLARFTAVDPGSGERRTLDPLELITPRQYVKASVRPDMLVQLAHRLAERERESGRDVEIRVEALVSLNGRPEGHLVDPDVDLASAPRTLKAADWVTREPPPRR